MTHLEATVHYLNVLYLDVWTGLVLDGFQFTFTTNVILHDSSVECHSTPDCYIMTGATDLYFFKIDASKNFALAKRI